jgi:hypothetical protein
MMSRRLFAVAAALFLGAGMLGAQQKPGAQPAPPETPKPASTNALGPRIKFATPIFDFVRAKAGDAVKHDFIFTNLGDQVLEVTAVNPGCGCTTVGDWTKRVEPGQTGLIPIQFNSAGYPAGPVQKHPTVICNDKTQPTYPLQIVGTLWKPIDVSPAYAILNMSSDSQTASTTVHITNNMDDFIAITGLESNKKEFTVDLKTNQPGKDFLLTITASQPLPPGTFQGQIIFKTSSTNMPAGSIVCLAIVQPAVVVSPAEIRLPAGPLAKALTNSVAIQNHSTNVLVLSEPSINAKDVGIRIEEAQGGRQFNVLVSFPEGFDIQGEPRTLTLKCNHPQCPVVKIPVTQNQAPRLTSPQSAAKSGANPSARLGALQNRLTAAEASQALLAKELKRLTAEKADLEARFHSLAAVEAQLARLKGKPAAHPAAGGESDDRGGKKLAQAVSLAPESAKDAATKQQASQPPSPQPIAPPTLSSSTPPLQAGEIQKKLAAAESEKARLEKEVQQVLAAKMDLEKQFNSPAVLEAQAGRLKAEAAAARRHEWVRQGALNAGNEKGGQRLVEAPAPAAGSEPANPQAQ